MYPFRLWFSPARLSFLDVVMDFKGIDILQVCLDNIFCSQVSSHFSRLSTRKNPPTCPSSSWLFRYQGPLAHEFRAEKKLSLRAHLFLGYPGCQGSPNFSLKHASPVGLKHHSRCYVQATPNPVGLSNHWTGVLWETGGLGRESLTFKSIKVWWPGIYCPLSPDLRREQTDNSSTVLEKQCYF